LRPKLLTIPLYQWKSKRTDFLFTVVLLLAFMCCFHLVSNAGLRKRPFRSHNTESYGQRLKDPMNIGMSIAAGLLVFSPLYVFRRKVPRVLTLDTDRKRLVVHKRTRKKEQVIALQNAGYYYYTLFFFSVFEIYHDFETSRASHRKRYLTVLIPKAGMAIRDKDLRELISLLREAGVETETGAKKRTWKELVWE
jgi:hypothetical protein